MKTFKSLDFEPISRMFKAFRPHLKALSAYFSYLSGFSRCFGALGALAAKLPEMISEDPQLLEMSLAVMGVCACEARRSPSQALFLAPKRWLIAYHINLYHI